MRRSPSELIERAYRGASPISDTGARLLTVYYDGLRLPIGSARWDEYEYFRALVRIVETASFSTVSRQHLQTAAATMHRGTRNSERTHRLAVRRLIQLLELRGELSPAPPEPRPSRAAKPRDLLERAYRRATPRSSAGAALLTIYFESLDLPACRSAQRQELDYFYALVRIVEMVEFPMLSIERLHRAAAAAHRGTKYSERVHRVAVRRAIRLLQRRGELPPNVDVARAAAVEAELAQTPASATPILRAWLAGRQHAVGWVHLHREARRLRGLELILDEASRSGTPLTADQALARWMRSLARRTVDCDCHPAARATDPLHCRQCGATELTHAVVYRPLARTQLAYRRQAEAYLRFRAARQRRVAQ